MCSLWDRIAGRNFTLNICEDNQACILVAQSGFSGKLRHITRTHKVNLASIKNEIDKPEVSLIYTDTSKQAADLFTKALEPYKWDNALQLIGMYSGPPMIKAN